MWAAEPSGVLTEWGHGLSVVAIKWGDVPIQSSQTSLLQRTRKRGTCPKERRGQGGKNLEVAESKGRDECDRNPLKDGRVGGRQGGREAETCDS